MVLKNKYFFARPQDKINIAINKIKKNGTRTLLISDKNKNLLGTLTEGDIQKALIDNSKLKDKIINIYNKNPKKIFFNRIRNINLKDFFINGQYGLVPVVNKKNRIIKFITWKDVFFEEKESILENIDVIIMAGGKGQRLKPITEILPKPLLPIEGKPILEHILTNFKYFRFKKFNLIINHQSDLILSYFKSNKSYNLSFVRENKPLGTVGGISLLKKKLSKNFILTNCDTLYKIDYYKFYNSHLKNNNDITIVISDKKYVFPYGICKTATEKLISLKEKPTYNFSVNTGLYLLKNSILKLIKKNQNLDMNDLIKKCLKLKKKVGVFKINENEWTDLGKLSDLKNFLN